MQCEDDKDLQRKLHFNPSTLETIDRAMLSYIVDLNLHTATNKGWTKTPVTWASAERSFQSKRGREIRDKQGSLILPIITVERKSVVKDLSRKGSYQSALFEEMDVEGSRIEKRRTIHQVKTRNFASSNSMAAHKQSTYPFFNQKVVYRTLSIPLPVYVTVRYEITIRAEYQQQVNDLTAPFITIPGGINAVLIRDGEHRYETFIDSDFQQNNNLSDYTTEERKFETKINFDVLGYLVGQGKNRDKPHFAVRENIVEVKIPRERITLGEIPPHELGGYYGLAGFPVPGQEKECPSQNFLTGRLGGSGPKDGSGVTVDNFASILSDQITVRERPAQIASNLRKFRVTNTIKANTELVFFNGLVQAVGAGEDYTVVDNGTAILFNPPDDDPDWVPDLTNEDISKRDTVYINYIKE